MFGCLNCIQAVLWLGVCIGGFHDVNVIVGVGNGYKTWVGFMSMNINGNVCCQI